MKERLDYHEEKVFRVARVQIGEKDVLINDFHKTNKSIIREQLLLLWDSNETYLELSQEAFLRTSMRET
jgi:hypothetical protein